MITDWRVVRTNPRSEFICADALGRDGFDVFFPRVKSEMPRFGQLEMPFFPGYLFVKWPDSENEYPTFQPRPRAQGWLTSGGEIATLPDSVVEELMHQCEEINGTGGIWKRFKAGDRVEVISKTIQGLAQVVDDARSPNSPVTVLIEFMGRIVSAKVPWTDLQVVSDDASSIRPRLLSRRTRGKGRWIRGYGDRASAQA